ncbi:divalent cation tolerance protein [Micromonospora echinaurantiaca]|uniref:Divalent cation tolerance protein n=1 Tax=Micromonospora echinaurantiaca TaxID=47857 RepID=A0A1C5II98_9ACTN|nr:divalent-cation tolerance protein CutA [Micromonospora echinaurantiaca]SCG58128.1 divalent cation tolerance protein [Micromonospora echinaurantiaca]
MSDVLQVYTAAGSQEAALRLAQGAVRARLAAGGQVIGPVEAVFWHEDTFGTGQEWQVVLRSSSARYPELERYLREHHEWTNPEIAAVPVVAGSAAYLRWVCTTTGTAEGSENT